MVNIRLITPHTNDRSSRLKDLREFADLGLNVSMVHLDSGPASIESEFDDALAAPYVVGRVIEAESEGIDAVIIDCIGDTALDAAREVVSIPVLGPGEISLHMAAMMGHKFSFLAVLDSIRPMIEKRAKIYGVLDKMVSVRAINLPVLSLTDNHDDLLRRLTEASIKAIAEDHADVLILGCASFVTVGDELGQNLRDAGYPVPVISPVKAAIWTAFSLVQMGISHSPLAYPGPSDKGIKGYKLPSSSKLTPVK